MRLPANAPTNRDKVAFMRRSSITRTARTGIRTGKPRRKVSAIPCWDSKIRVVSRFEVSAVLSPRTVKITNVAR